MLPLCIMKESPKMMYIGQHSAGRFSKETPEEVAGFTTSGMGPCCHVIIYDKESERCVFSHADFASDLKTDVSEWLKWVNNGKSSPSFKVYVGEDVDGDSGYLEQVMAATASFMQEEMPDYVKENFPDGITAENLKRGGGDTCL